MASALEMYLLRLVRWTAAIALLACVLNPVSMSIARQTKTNSFAELAEEAKKASDENRLEDATSLYRRAVMLRPRWVEGWWSLGTLQYDQNQYSEAARALEKLIALQPENGTAHAMLGLCQFELGKDEPALRNLLAAERLGIVKDEQLRKVSVYHLGVLQLRARKFRDAKETLDQLAKDRVRTKELIAALGQAALLVRPQEAPPEGTAGASVIGRAGEAEALLAAKEFEPAKQKYAELASEFPDYPNLHFAFGRLLLETHETDEAVEEFQRELHRDPRNVNSLLEIAAVRYLVDSQEGLKYAEEAAKLAPAMPFVHYLLGLLYLDTNSFARAISELEIAKRSYLTVPEVYFALGNAYAHAGRKVEAARARATFARLNAMKKDRSAPTTYGEHSLGLANGQIDPEKSPKPTE
jgi:predicted Zn-dependent protease